MRSLRTTAVATTAVAVLSWTGPSQAHDHDDATEMEEDTGTQSTTTTTTTGEVDATGTTVTPQVSSPYQGQPYQGQPYPGPGYTATTSTTTVTAADYDSIVGADRAGTSYRPNRPLLLTGAGIFVGSYGASVIAAAASDTQGDDKLYIPVAGPWLDLADRECGLGDCGSREDVNQALLIGSGVLQAAGVGLAIVSLIVPEKRESDTMASARARSAAAAKPTVKVMPINVRGGGGVGAFGVF